MGEEQGSEDETIKPIRHKTRHQYSVEERIRWSKEIVKARKTRFAGHTKCQATSREIQDLRRMRATGDSMPLVVHKFDRVARNRTNSLAIKSLLRYDYGIKVFSATEPSEDSDGPIGALIEGIMEAVADWYSRNLATEVSKGKKERGEQSSIARRGKIQDGGRGKKKAAKRSQGG